MKVRSERVSGRGRWTRCAMVIAGVAGLCLASVASAWDAAGHRTITLLAIDRMDAQLASGDKDGPAGLAFVFSESGRAQAAYQSGEPDRYRAIRIGALKHVNDPDHYIDLEDLEAFGLTLKSLPPLRYEYLRALAIAKAEHPDNFKPYNEKTDPARTQEWPGFLPFGVMEHYAKLVSSFRQIRVLGALNDPARSAQMEAAKANVLYEMGQLSHLVGDAAQPLHTTKHHHGWVDENPDGFTTNRGIHAYIDGTILTIHELNDRTLKAADGPERPIADANNPWPEVLEHIQRSNDQVRPLYVLQRSGDLEKDAGKKLISERLLDAGSMLGSLYAQAWKASAMTEKDKDDFIRYDAPADPAQNPMKSTPHTSQPAAETPAQPATTSAPTTP